MREPGFVSSNITNTQHQEGYRRQPKIREKAPPTTPAVSLRFETSSRPVDIAADRANRLRSSLGGSAGGSATPDQSRPEKTTETGVVVPLKRKAA